MWLGTTIRTCNMHDKLPLFYLTLVLLSCGPWYPPNKLVVPLGVQFENHWVKAMNNYNLQDLPIEETSSQWKYFVGMVELIKLFFYIFIETSRYTTRHHGILWKISKWSENESGESCMCWVLFIIIRYWQFWNDCDQKGE